MAIANTPSLNASIRSVRSRIRPRSLSARGSPPSSTTLLLLFESSGRRRYGVAAVGVG
jgi:hypothetical protein